MNTLRQCELVGQSVRVEFRWHVDRYRHAISRRDGTGWIEVLNSVEGTPADSWPASPPLQSLHLDGRPGGGQLALLVGMAGGSHWSLSVELDPAADRVRFDVACRVRGASGPLGSRYRSLPAAQSADARGAIVVVGAQPGLRLELDDRIAAARWVVAGDCVSVEPHETGPAAAQTIRWGYSIGPVLARPAT